MPRPWPHTYRCGSRPPGVTSLMSCMHLIGLYLLESFLHASSPLIWRGSPLIRVPKILKIPALRDLSASDSDKTVSITWCAASLADLVADLNWNAQSRHPCSPLKLSFSLRTNAPHLSHPTPQKKKEKQQRHQNTMASQCQSAKAGTQSRWRRE